jgi:hypothetical protein
MKMNAALNFLNAECLAFKTIAGEIVYPRGAELKRIQKENLEAARELNPAYSYMRNFEHARTAWLPRTGKQELSDAREMAWRRSRVDRILKCGGGVE